MARNAFDLFKSRAIDTPPNVTLAHTWDVTKDVNGWMMSEKLDGVRAVWDGRNFKSRTNKPFKCQSRFRTCMSPMIALDGELFSGDFKTTVSSVRSGVWSAQMKYYVFDSPSLGDPYEVRYERLVKMFKDHPFIVVLEHQFIDSAAHLMEYFTYIVKEKGGEGVMVRNPAMLYESGRSHNLLKVKQMQDDEAVVVGHVEGCGKHVGRLGAIMCEYRGKTFKIGTGFTDEERESPPALGTKVTFAYYELTENNVPRFPVFKAIRVYE